MMSGMGVASKVESAKVPKTYFEKLRESREEFGKMKMRRNEKDRKN